MARIIRFPLKMSNGAEVRTLEELQENFDLPAILGYFADGKLQTWLTNRYYDEAAEKVGALSADMPDLNARLCKILGVEYQPSEEETDLEYIKRRNEKKRILAEVTDDREIFEHIDWAALTQDDLFDALDTGTDTVYLYGERFSIPAKRNTKYIGLNCPLVALEGKRTLRDYQNSGITFENVRFEKFIAREFRREEKKRVLSAVTKDPNVLNHLDAAALTQEDLLEALKANPRTVYLCGESFTIPYQGKRKYIGLNNPLVKLEHERFSDDYEAAGITFEGVRFEEGANQVSQGEKLFLSGKYKEAFPIIKKEAENGNPCSMYYMMLYFNNGYNTVQIDREEARRWCKDAKRFDNPLLLSVWYNIHDEADESVINRNRIRIIEMAKKGNVYAFLFLRNTSLDEIYELELGREMTVEEYESEAFAKMAIGWLKKQSAVLKKAAENGCADAQFWLGYLYLRAQYFDEGGEQIEDEEKAIMCFRKAAEQGLIDAQWKLAEFYANGDFSLPQDETKEIEWLRKIAKQGDQGAADKLKELGYSV